MKYSYNKRIQGIIGTNHFMLKYISSHWDIVLVEYESNTL